MDYKISNSAWVVIAKQLKRIDRTRTMSQKTFLEKVVPELSDCEAEMERSRLEFYGGKGCFKSRWKEELQNDHALSAAYCLDNFLAGSFDSIELSEMVCAAADKCGYKYKNEFREEFENYILDSIPGKARFAIFPVLFREECLFPGLLREELSGPRTRVFGKLSIIRSGSTESEIIDLLNENYNADINGSLGGFTHHEEVSNHALSKFELVVFPVLCSLDRARDNIYGKFNWFKYLIDFYSVVLGCFKKRIGEGGPNHYFSVNCEQSSLERFPIHREGGCVFSFDLSTGFLDELERTNFEFLLSYEINDESDAFGRIANSMFFFSRGLREEDNISRFLFYVISIESVFTGLGEDRITESLVRCIKSTAFDNDEKELLGKQMSDIYSLRSAVMHRGKTIVPHNKVEMSESLAQKAIAKSVDVYVKEYERTGKAVRNDEWNLIVQGEECSSVGVDEKGRSKVVG